MRNSLLILTITMAFSACTSSKETAVENSTPATKQTTDLSTQGFESAKVVAGNTDSDHCAFLIELENGQLLEPQVFNSSFHKAGLSVWIKYLPQRRPSRCGSAMPVSISEIKLK